jgi:hypothetical protein
MPAPSRRSLLPIVLAYLPVPIAGAILSAAWNVGASPEGGASDMFLRGTALTPPLFLPVVLLAGAIAHLGNWMAQGAQMLRRIAAGTYRHDEIDVDAENERFLAAMKDVPLETVHLQLTAAHAELLAAWAQLPEVTDDAAYWVRKAGPEHMEEHVPRLEAWLSELERR